MLKVVMVAALVAATGAPAFAQEAPPYGAQAAAAAETAQELRDQSACSELAAKEAQAQPIFYSPLAGGIAGALLIGAVTGMANGLATIPRAEHALRRCMADRGYAPRQLTAEETAQVKALKSRAERAQWYAEAPLFQAVAASPLHTVETWDPVFNRPVTLVRDPVTGEMVKTFVVHP